jgi:hypothetical protein
MNSRTLPPNLGSTRRFEARGPRATALTKPLLERRRLRRTAVADPSPGSLLRVFPA